MRPRLRISDFAVLARLAVATAVPVVMLVVPAPVLGHQLNDRYEAPLPLIAYVAGAALAVAMSFVFVMLRNVPPARDTAAAPRTLPVWLQRALQAIGLIGWLWIVIQAL